MGKPFLGGIVFGGIFLAATISIHSAIAAEITNGQAVSTTKISLPSPQTSEAAANPAALSNSTSEVGGIKLKSAFTGIVQGLSIQDGLVGMSAGVAVLRLMNKATYNSWLSFDLGFEGYFVEGNTKNFFNNDGKSSDGFYLDEAIVNVEPTNWLLLRGGIFLVQTNPVMSIMNRIPFPGLQQKITLPLAKETNLSFTAFEGVPVSSGVTKGYLDLAPSAFYLSQGVQLDTEVIPLKSKINLAVNRFEFGNLSSNIAYESLLIGTDPRSFDGIGPNTRFTIGFGGYETAAQVVTVWNSKYSTAIKGSSIINLEAPEDRNFGAQGQIAVTRKFGNILLTPMVKVYRMESDLIPASYTYLPYRLQNRSGYCAQLSLELEKERVTFYGSYTQGNVIQNNAYVSDREMYTAGVEAKYDIL